MAKKYALRRGRSILSSFLHVALNILLGVGSIIVTAISGSWILGILLVIISKWRVFAVRPRFWWANIKANLVDFIVGASFVLLAYAANSASLAIPLGVLPSLPLIYVILAIGYTLWLIFLKPLSSERATAAQSLVAVFLGVSAAATMAGAVDSIWLSLICFIIGYGAARHVLIQNDEKDFFLLSFLAGLLFAEIAWLSQSWLIIYTFFDGSIIIPQLALILTIFSFVLGTVYKTLFKHEGKIHFADVAIPVIFSILLIAIIVIGFSQPIFNK